MALVGPDKSKAALTASIAAPGPSVHHTVYIILPVFGIQEGHFILNYHTVVSKAFSDACHGAQHCFSCMLLHF